MMNITEVAAEEKSQLGECPVWCERKRCLYWIDIVGRTLFALDSSTSDVRSWLLPEQVGSFALTNNDDVLLLGLASRLAMFNLVDRSVTTIAPSPGNHGTRIGDGRCDREGNFVFGTMDEAEQPRKIGAFYRLNAASLTVEPLDLPPTAISNGICFSPDGATFYFCDSMQKKIFCCDYPSLNCQRVFADVVGGGAPDGSCIDSQGFLWNGEWGGGRLVRYSPQGIVDLVVATAAQSTTCPAIGGLSYNTMYCTTAQIGLKSRTEADGALLCVEMNGIRGLPEARFAG